MRDTILRRRVLAPLLALGLAVGLAACSDDAPPFSATVLQSPYQVADTVLTDTDEQPYSLRDDTDKRLTLVFFGYVNCVDICPAVLNRLASAVNYLDDEDREAVDVVLVTSDPTVDTPETMKEYLARFSPDFIGLSGSWDDVKSVADSLKVGLDRQDPGGHQTQVMGLDNADEAPVLWGSDTTPRQYAADIHELLQG